MSLIILVVDDDPAICLSISDYLHGSGYAVIRAENGRDALILVEKYRPHLLITDIIMPGMDGYELIKKIREQPFFRLLPVILLTSKTKTEERILGYQVGCDVYLPKPFELPELGAVVRNLLERSQLINAEKDFSVYLASQVDSRFRGNDKLVSADRPVSDAKNLTVDSRKIAPLEIDLTHREQEVLSFLTWGLSNAKIGDKMHLSSRTVEKYVSSLLRKTSTCNRAELVRFAIAHQLVD
ncbi:MULTISPECIES: response regulator transcription factor [Planktothricoides]|uniref:DNA-binding response regulator n=2 Tax=Planktothricoides raciborskii TaxID=132608 RepID=A0AAU8JG87_9CYAN|nr:MULTISPECIES: DNA-binding response regulator [Planktothricoides]KOR35416.1 chemotaxis protein CheY [Planktothricoides sp. SR001]MBD2545938.1 response regulator [Planktothricoides raciborskii FACHB-1370]MBD2584055.1 response regulator [Planktothricoides raciborskii FACHB-1261]